MSHESPSSGVIPWTCAEPVVGKRRPAAIARATRRRFIFPLWFVLGCRQVLPGAERDGFARSSTLDSHARARAPREGPPSLGYRGSQERRAGQTRSLVVATMRVCDVRAHPVASTSAARIQPSAWL